MSKLAKAGYKNNRDKVEVSYKGILDNKTGSEEDFFKAVTALAKSKIGGRIFEFPEWCSNNEDYAQMVAFKVWRMLPSHQGGVDTIYRHVNRVIFTTREDAFHEIKAETEIKEPLQVEIQGEDGAFTEDNPLLHPRDYPTYRRKLPDFIQGIDLEICGYIREGYSYEKIAEVMSMKLSAVKMRVFEMRRKVQEMKNAKS